MAMTDTDGAARAHALQAAFFAAPNLFRLDATLLPPGLAATMQALTPCLKRHAKGDDARPILLPYRQTGNECTVWYACAASEMLLRALEAELRAFIGPSYAHFHQPEDGPLKADDHALPPIDHSGWSCFAMWTVNSEEDLALAERWCLYWDLLDQRPASALRIPKGFDALRGDFDRALLARDEVAARAAFSAMRERFGLSAENRLFLDIRLWAGLEQWEAISDHHLLPTLVNLNLPQETYGDIVEALYMTEVFPYEQADRLEKMLEAFDEQVVSTARALFRTRRRSSRPAVLKSFALFELLQSPPQGSVLANLLSQLPQGAFGALDAQVRRAAAQLQPQGEDADAGWKAYESEQFDRAYELLWSQADSVNLLRTLIRCADETGDPTKARATVARIEAALGPIRAEVESRSPKTLPRLRDLARQAPDSGLTWAQRMTWRRESGETLDTYLDRWREWARSPADDLQQSAGFGGEAAGLLENIVLEHPEAHLQVATLCFERFVFGREPESSLKPVYKALLETLRFLDSLGDAEMRLVRGALMHLVQAGVTAADYAKAVRDVQAMFEAARSPHHMRWALDICDGLAVAPCPDSSTRAGLLSAVLQAGAEFGGRMSLADLAVMKMLAAEAGFAIPASPGTASSVATQSPQAYDGIVALYSLDADASQRAAKVLRTIYQGLDVRVNADVVCTPALKNLAQRADIFVFAWKTSKHAAFYCIKGASWPGQSLVMAQGAGTTSMVDAAVRSLAHTPSRA
jgi:hypothetical protein